MPKPKKPPKLATLEEIEQAAKQSPDLPAPIVADRYSAGTPVVDLIESDTAYYPTKRNIPGKPDHDPSKRITIPRLEQFARMIVAGMTVADAIRACYPAASNWSTTSISRRGAEAARLTRARVDWLIKQAAEQTDVTPAMIEAHLWQLAQAGRASYVDKWGSQRLVDGGTSARAAETLARIKGLVSDGKFQLAADSINISMDFGSGAAPVVDVQAVEIPQKPVASLESGPILPVVDAKPENGEA